MSSELLKQITVSLEEVDADAVMDQVQQALAGGLEPLKIIQEGLIPGMEVVGERFASGEYFLPQLIIAGKTMQDALTVLEPSLTARDQKVESAGVIVLGTVKGDIHEIGKSLVGSILAANGFKVFDLGIDVPTATFVTKVQETGADIVALSALLTTTMTVQRDVIDALLEAGIRDRVKVIIGGAPISAEWAQSIGADGYAEDAMGAVQLCKRLMA